MATNAGQLASGPVFLTTWVQGKDGRKKGNNLKCEFMLVRCENELDEWSNGESVYAKGGWDPNKLGKWITQLERQEENNKIVMSREEWSSVSGKNERIKR